MNILQSLVDFAGRFGKANCTWRSRECTLTGGTRSRNVEYVMNGFAPFLSMAACERNYVSGGSCQQRIYELLTPCASQLGRSRRPIPAWIRYTDHRISSSRYQLDAAHLERVGLQFAQPQSRRA